MEAIGALLGGGGGAPGASGGSAPGQSPPHSGVADPSMAGAPGMDAQRQMLMQTIEQIRALGEGVKQLAAVNPLLADPAQQIQQLLKQMLMVAAGPAPAQTGSGMAVPGNGGGMA